MVGCGSDGEVLQGPKCQAEMVKLHFGSSWMPWQVWMEDQRLAAPWLEHA